MSNNLEAKHYLGVAIISLIGMMATFCLATVNVGFMVLSLVFLVSFFLASLIGFIQSREITIQNHEVENQNNKPKKDEDQSGLNALSFLFMVVGGIVLLLIVALLFWLTFVVDTSRMFG